MTPMERHTSLVCRSRQVKAGLTDLFLSVRPALGLNLWYCPDEQACYNNVPEGLQCSGCLEKAEEWEHSAYNALFCTKSDPVHKKSDPVTLWKAVVDYLDQWALEITPEMI